MCVAATWACSSSETTAPGEGVVVSVFDGDTVSVEIDGREETVRLIGVDTPETVHPTKPVQCFGPEASAFAKDLLPRGTRVRVVRDVEARDAYDRLLAYLFVVADTAANDTFVNLELVRLGYARPFPYPPNTAHRDDFTRAAWEARDAGRGLWTACPG